MNRKLKVYLDTSVISHLQQEDVPEKMADTRQLWEMFKNRKFDVYLSTVTLREIERCSEPKKTKLIDYLNEIQFTTLAITGALSPNLVASIGYTPALLDNACAPNSILISSI